MMADLTRLALHVCNKAVAQSVKYQIIGCGPADLTRHLQVNLGPGPPCFLHVFWFLCLSSSLWVVCCSAIHVLIVGYACFSSFQVFLIVYVVVDAFDKFRMKHTWATSKA